MIKYIERTNDDTLETSLKELKSLDKVIRSNVTEIINTRWKKDVTEVTSFDIKMLKDDQVNELYNLLYKFSLEEHEKLNNCGYDVAELRKILENIKVIIELLDLVSRYKESKLYNK